MRDRSFASAGAAGVQAVEAAGVCIATVLAGIDTATGKSYQVGSGIALTLIGFATVVALAVVAAGLAKMRRWSWTPALLIQLFTFIVGIYLLQGHRYDWGGASVALAIAAAILLLLPRTLTAYGRGPADPPAADPPVTSKTTASKTTASKTTTSKTTTSKRAAGKAATGKGGR